MYVFFIWKSTLFYFTFTSLHKNRIHWTLNKMTMKEQRRLTIIIQTQVGWSADDNYSRLSTSKGSETEQADPAVSTTNVRQNITSTSNFMHHNKKGKGNNVLNKLNENN